MRLEDILTLLAALEREGVRYAVFGGLAMAAHGLDRGTRDLDLFVAPDPDNIARLRAALWGVFDDPRPSNTARPMSTTPLTSCPAWARRSPSMT
ncbi:hypothetical protein BH24ACT15_BH24ACT15_00910 [soil metagenome]